MSNRLTWGIIGAGHIARAFARGLAESETGILHAVASRTREGAERFATEYPARIHVGYQALIDDPEVQAVYIATPHPMHVEWALRAMAAGKHVLVEKPMGMNSQEAQVMIQAARRHGVLLMEAFMYRCHPQTARIVEIVTRGVLGEISLIQASFCYDAGPNHRDPLNRAYAQELGGGAILDVGCYPLSFARLIAGAAAGKPFADPLALKGCGRLGPAGGDLWAAATLDLPGGIVASIDTAVGLSKPGAVAAAIYGSRGHLTVDNPWIPGRHESRCAMTLHVDGKDEAIVFDSPRYLYAYEVDAVGRAVAAGAHETVEMSWADSLGNMRALDQWRREIGLVYEQEKAPNHAHPIGRLPLRRAPRVPMPTARIPGIDKPVSRLVMGFAHIQGMPETAMLLDEYLERGGNTIDTSHGYGWPSGVCERNLGWWLRHRGVRDQVVVVEKGANYPNNTPDGLTKELQLGLENLQLDCVDLYMIHRDNEQVPIDEWIDSMEANRRAGRIRRYGVSNFSIARLQAATDYAKRRGYDGIAAVSNQFSLARMLAPVWEFCLSASDAESRAWFVRTQMPLMPWSSQARGFFTPRAGRGVPANEEFTRCWNSEDNFCRKDRAEELARRKGVLPIQIALAWVLHQPFPTFPMIGPLSLDEIDSTFASLEVSLTPAEVAWLDLREEATLRASMT